METHPCPECGAPLKPGATYCLACDTPVVDTERGLSVAEAVPVAVGRPLLGLLVIVGVIVALGGAAYGTVQYMHDRKVATAAIAAMNARDGLALVVRAESGQATACKRAPAYVAGVPKDVRRLCREVVGQVPGAQLEHVRTGTPHLAGKDGTVRITATFADHRGTKTVDRVFHLVQEGKQWRLSWNGQPVV